jgi:hypothetical protein
VFAPIVSSVKIVKNQNGAVYWPQFGLNNIGNMVLGQAYEVTMFSANTLIVYGIACNPAATPINLHTGWNHLAYLRLFQAPITTMMSSIAGTYQFVKNGTGQVYWPAFNFNGIGNMKPGAGYRINMYSNQTFYYPANAMAAKIDNEPVSPMKYSALTLTGNDMTLGIPEDAWTVAPVNGAEIGVFTTSGALVGAGVYEGGNIAISIFGDEANTMEVEGMTTGQEFFIVVYANGTEERFDVTNWVSGSQYYANNQVSVAGKLTSAAPVDALSLGQNYPNPVASTTEISFYLPESGMVTLSIYNILGEKMSDIINEEMNAGNHTISYDARKLAIGNYMYKITTVNGEQTRIMNVVK